MLVSYLYFVMNLFTLWCLCLVTIHIISAKEISTTNTLKPLTFPALSSVQKFDNTRVEFQKSLDNNVQKVANFKFGIGGINGGIAGGLFSGSGDTIAHHIGQNLYYFGNKPLFNSSPYGYPGRPVAVLVHNKPSASSSSGTAGFDRKKTSNKPSKPNKLGVGNKPYRPGGGNKFGNHDQSQSNSFGETSGQGSYGGSGQGSTNGNVDGSLGGHVGGDYGYNAEVSGPVNGQFEASGNNGIDGGVGGSGNFVSGFGGSVGEDDSVSGGASGNGNGNVASGGGSFGFGTFRPRPVYLGFLGQGNSGASGHGAIQGNFDSQHHASINLSGGVGGFGSGGFGGGIMGFG